MKLNYLLAVTLITIAFFSISEANANNKEQLTKLSGKKVFHLESYNMDYHGGSSISIPISNILKEHQINLKTFHMDTKNNPSLEYKKKIALTAKKLIEEFNPDLIITTDDNAAKYVIAPYFRDKNIPIVFAGINWSAEQYGFYNKSNITGILEVSDVRELVETIKSFYKINKISALMADSTTDRKEIKNIKEVLGIDFSEVIYAKNFKEWKEAIRYYQDKTSAIYIYNPAKVKDLNKKEAVNFINDNNNIITCSNTEASKDIVTITYAKITTEQGEWAANTAIQILLGTPPSKIAIAKNQKGTLFINERDINKLRIEIPEEIFEIAKIVK